MRRIAVEDDMWNNHLLDRLFACWIWIRMQHNSVLRQIGNVIFGGSLESPWWLLLAFCPKILGGGGDLQIVILLKKECCFSGADNVRWWRHSNTTRW